MSTQLTIEQAAGHGYEYCKILSTGECAGIHRMAFTVGLFVGLSTHFYRTRFCYPDMDSAKQALQMWDGRNDPPGPWIKEKGEVDRNNPNLIPT